MNPDYDVLILGAGISGISAACHLLRECPGKRFAILERRHSMGGTWDLFRYPGIRSDSDMSTFGFDFKPWNKPNVLADGPSILNYIKETAREFRVEDKIIYHQKVIRADWDSQQQRWTVTALNEQSGETTTYTAAFVLGCMGYYNYDQGFRPHFRDEEKFKGDILHPQHWPENYDYSGKKVVIIGSGATAVTLLPTMTDKAAHVTMLQRSPTYVASVPSVDPLHLAMSKYLPPKVVYKATRLRNTRLQSFIYQLSRRQPELLRKFLLSRVRAQLGGSSDMKHFTPSYNPWDQRLCAVPSGDMFKAIRAGKASVVTDQIDRFDETGIVLKSGQHLDADLIITATGLSIQILGGAQVYVDGQAVDPGQVMAYQSVMLEDIPNAAMVFGYTNSSWTLKADMVSHYVCQLLNHMDRHGYSVVIPRDRDDCITEDTILGKAMSSGYIQRAQHTLPKQGSKGPWVVNNDYFKDKALYAKVNFEVPELEFIKSSKPSGTGKKRGLRGLISAVTG